MNELKSIVLVQIVQCKITNFYLLSYNERIQLIYQLRLNDKTFTDDRLSERVNTLSEMCSIIIIIEKL